MKYLKRILSLFVAKIPTFPHESFQIHCQIMFLGHFTRRLPVNIFQRSLSRALVTQASSSLEDKHKRPRPLEGIRVLEIGQLIAGPFCGTLLGCFGAEVIKVEPPKIGDPLRIWRLLDVDGTSPWWRSIARNKKSVTINLRTDEGRELVRKLANMSDVLIENFKPGTMEKWSLGPDDFSKTNPSLIYTRVSGYGQTGPYASRPGYASVCEGMGGFRFVNGYPGQPPVRPNISLGDSLAGVHAAFGVVLALLAREKIGKGQVVDTAIYESVLNMMEGVIPEIDRIGAVRQPSGTTVTGIVPTNTYGCSDGKYVIIGGNGDSIYKRLMIAAGRDDMATDKYETNADRVKYQEEIDTAISNWTRSHPSDYILSTLEEISVPAGKIYDAHDILEDSHVQARGMVEQVEVHKEKESWTVKVPGIVPKLEETPGKTEWAGPELGAHNNEILRDLLCLTTFDIINLQAKNAIGKTL